MDYPTWRRRRLRERQGWYRAEAERGLFSLLTPVFDTPPEYLRPLVASVLAQDYPHFEWVVVDNGCRRQATCEVLEELASHPQVRLVRLPTNRGIMGGMHAALERASGRYVVPVDSDDLLTPDALRIVAHFLQRMGYPAAVYSDEDKLDACGRPCHPYCKPDWDPVLFTNCCYVAHLCAIERQAAQAAGAYRDPAAGGCHDWDTFWRLHRAGHAIAHVPEILYSWRMHPASTASCGTHPKPYAYRSQYAVLQDHLRARGLADRLEVVSNPLYHDIGMWRVRRRSDRPAAAVEVWVRATSDLDRIARLVSLLGRCQYPIARLTLCGPLTRTEMQACTRMCQDGGWPIRTVPTAAALLTRDHAPLLADLPADALVALVESDCTPVAVDWLWEAVGLLELFEDADVVGGHVTDAAGRTHWGAGFFGIDGLVGSPDQGRHRDDYGYYGLHICQRSVDTVHPGCLVGRAGFLAAACEALPAGASYEHIALHLGATARRLGRRVIYSPHVRIVRSAHVAASEGASQARQPDGGQGAVELCRRGYCDAATWIELVRQARCLADTPPWYYAPVFCRHAERGYWLVSPDEQEVHEIPYLSAVVPSAPGAAA
ncbi:MAG: hypothetical protein C4297_07350 [Gemmataceae bacterium]